MSDNLDKRILQAKRAGRYVQTSRLMLLPLDVSDAADAFKWCGDPDVTEFMNYTRYTNADDVTKWIADSGHNCFGIFLKDGRLIGSGDVHLNSNGVHELGYNLAKAYWGKGYATEASKAMLSFRIAQGVTEFACEHAVDNVRSGRVIQKCGFEYVTDGMYTSFDGTRSFNSRKYSLHVDSHSMNVDGKWFEKIANGSKTVELRLNDEKRRCINVGDYVVLNNLDETADLTKCVVQVIALYKFGNFEELYKNLDMVKCGYSRNDVPDPSDMLAYYSSERQAECGVVGIEFDLLAVL